MKTKTLSKLFAAIVFSLSAIVTVVGAKEIKQKVDKVSNVAEKAEQKSKKLEKKRFGKSNTEHKTYENRFLIEQKQDTEYKRGTIATH